MFFDVLWGPFVSLSVCAIISSFSSTTSLNSDMKLFCILMTPCHPEAFF